MQAYNIAFSKTFSTKVTPKLITTYETLEAAWVV